MKLTSRGRYAITAVLDMVLHEGDAPVTLAGIGTRNNISSLYLEKLFGQLKAQGLVRGVRGPSGGYRLARPEAEISVGDVLDAVDNLDATNCGGARNCAGGSPCLAHSLWERLNISVLGFLHGISLQQLADEIREEVTLGKRLVPSLRAVEQKLAIREYQ